MTGFTLIAGWSATYFVTDLISDPAAAQMVGASGFFLTIYVMALTEKVFKQ